MDRALIITNAGEGIGGGHITRCLALAEGLEDSGVRVSWVLNDDARSMAESLAIQDVSYVGDPFDPVDFELVIENEGGVDLTIVDSYRATEGFFDMLAECVGRKIMLIVDEPGANGEETATFIADYSIDASDKRYGGREEDGRVYLLGPSYALMRREIRDAQIRDGDYTLMISGAFDVAGASLDAARWAAPSWGELKIVCGPFVSDKYELGVRDAAAGKQNVEVLRSPSNLPDIMAGAGRIICTASVTMHEALSLNKTTAVFAATSAQLAAAEMAEAKGVALSLGSWDQMTGDRFERAFSYKADREKIDGLVDRNGGLHCARAVIREWSRIFEQEI